MTQNKKVWLADAACLFTAVLWGAGFIASQWAINSGLNATAIMVGRFWLAALIMLAVSLPKLRGVKKKDILQGALAGVFLFFAFYAQILGQGLTTVSHSAFLTSVNVIIVPFLVWAFTRRRPPVKVFLLAGLTLAGIGVLTLGGGAEAGIYAGDGLILLCALGFALHIAYLGMAVKNADPRVVNLVQLCTAALLSTAVLPFTGIGSPAAINWGQGVAAVLYLGVFSTCICYFLQTTAQKYTSAGKASILLSTEGMFGTLFAVVLGFEPLTPHMVAGGGIIMLS
ncbi:MAG: DMT family transporter, partial [Oscillospiraceae bacterium]